MNKNLKEVRERLAKASELTKEELLKLNKGKTKTSSNAKPEPFNGARLHPSMSYDEKTGSFYIDHSKL